MIPSEQVEQRHIDTALGPLPFCIGTPVVASGSRLFEVSIRASPFMRIAASVRAASFIPAP